MRDLIKFILCFIIIVVIYNNFGYVVEVATLVLDVVCGFIVDICHQIK